MKFGAIYKGVWRSLQRGSAQYTKGFGAVYLVQFEFVKKYYLFFKKSEIQRSLQKVRRSLLGAV